MKRTLLYGIALVVLIGGAAAYYMYNKPHQDMRRATPAFKLTATELFSEYDTDESTANEKYLGKVIEVSGTVRSVERGEEGRIAVTLESGHPMFGVVCELDELSEPRRTEFDEGEQVTFRCVCTGKLMDVVLNRCIEP
ncbi:MAG: hypothetical protein D6818_04545 [Bacteroidetes bacterium]|nr:MAG: hypothetical protein D6818_04545 [Bacteroidota bacterium]